MRARPLIVASPLCNLEASIGPSASSAPLRRKGAAKVIRFASRTPLICMLHRDRSERGLVEPIRLGVESGPGLPSPPVRLVGRRRGDLIFIDAVDVWAFEAAGRLTFVHCTDGRFDLDISLKELEALLGASILRPHRNWLVYTAHVREWRRCPERSVLVVGGRAGMAGVGIEVPIAPDRLPAVRDALLAGAVGLRRRAPRSASTDAAEGSDLMQ